MEWIVAIIVWLLVCSLICFLIARATCRNYRNGPIDEQIAVNASQREVNDALREYIDAVSASSETLGEYVNGVNARVDTLPEYIDAHDRVLQVRQEITLEALFVIRDMLELMEHPGDKRLAFSKFVEKRNDLDIKLDALREDE